MKIFQKIKSKSGFTLIELLVVIAILAILAIIAVPQVAGLIEKANVSADTSTVETMNKAIEQWGIEYELYATDLNANTVDDASTVVKRVHSVLSQNGVEDPVNQEQLKVFEETKIDPYEKFPITKETAESIILEYTKTDSRFLPKVKNNAFWYSLDMGLVITAKTTSTLSELDEKILNTNPNLESAERWIKLFDLNTIILPPSEPTAAPTKGPKPTIGTKVQDEFYEYSFNQIWTGNSWRGLSTGETEGYGMRVLDNTLSTYGANKTEIEGWPVVNMRSLFKNNSCTTELDISALDTTNIVEMHSMFADCKASSINFGSKFDTSNVCNMTEMFRNICASTLDLGNNFDTSNVTSMYEMFRFCKASTIHLGSKFNVSSVTTMHLMFNGTNPSLVTMDNQESIDNLKNKMTALGISDIYLDTNKLAIR